MIDNLHSGEKALVPDGARFEKLDVRSSTLDDVVTSFDPDDPVWSRQARPAGRRGPRGSPIASRRSTANTGVSRGRSHYRTVVGHPEEMSELGLEAEFEAFVDYLSEKHSNRPAFLDELGKAGL